MLHRKLTYFHSPDYIKNTFIKKRNLNYEWLRLSQKKKEIHVWEIKSLTMLFCSVPTEMK